jgi:carboxylesterase
MVPQFRQLFQGEEHQAFTWSGNDHGVVLVHGFPGTPAEMHPLAIMMHEAGWTVQGVLLPGFGAEIDTLATRTTQHWASAIDAAIRQTAKQCKHVVLVGLSMGAALAIQATSRHADKISALVLLAPFWQIKHVLWHSLPVLRFAVPQFKPFQLFKPDFTDPETRKGIRTYLPEADLDDPDVQRSILDFAIPTQVINQIRIAGSNGHSCAPQVKAPTLIIQGTEDDLVQPDLTRELSKRFSGIVRYTEVSGGHDLLNTEKAAWPNIQRTLREFLHTHQLGNTSW